MSDENANEEPEGAEETSVVVDAAEDKSAPSGSNDAPAPEAAAASGAGTIDPYDALIAAVEAQGGKVLFERDGTPVITLPEAKVKTAAPKTPARKTAVPATKLTPELELEAVRAANLQRLGITD